jgi:hypothetical protein
MQGNVKGTPVNNLNTPPGSARSPQNFQRLALGSGRGCSKILCTPFLPKGSLLTPPPTLYRDGPGACYSPIGTVDRPEQYNTTVERG